MDAICSVVGGEEVDPRMGLFGAAIAPVFITEVANC